MGEHKKDPKQIDLIDYIEDAETSGPPVLEKTLSDEDLDRAGLVAVKAFVRSKASKNAERVRKAAERREKGENGPPRKQLNLQAPVDDEAREAIKALNQALVEQALTPEDIRKALSEENLAWKERATNAEREREQLRRQLEEAEQQIDQLTRDVAEALRNRNRWLGWPLRLLFRGQKD